MIASGNTASVDIGESPSRPDRLEDTLWNVGLALYQMKRLGRPLTLEDTERDYLVSLASQWIDCPGTKLPGSSDTGGTGKMYELGR